MEPITNNPPVIVILGPTASGKSALALNLAERFNGELIAADSRTIYRGMDIGTAKPSSEEQRRVKHHLIDIRTPDQTFSAAEFQRLAQAAIGDITARGKLPIVVGGTGLYIDALIYDFTFRPLGDPEQRRALEQLTIEQLQAKLTEDGIPWPSNDRNPRHLVRALEAGGAGTERSPLRPNTLVIGLSPDKAVLDERIAKRVEQMVAVGFPDEVRQLAAEYGWDAPGLQAPGYKAFRAYIMGEATLDQAKQQFIQNDVQYEIGRAHV